MDLPQYGAPLTETGHIWGFLALSGERVGVNGKGVAEAYFRRFVSSSVKFNLSAESTVYFEDIFYLHSYLDSGHENIIATYISNRVTYASAEINDVFWLN